MVAPSHDRGHTIHEGNILRILLALGSSNSSNIDHIVSISCLLLISPTNLSLPACAFRTARKSVTLHFDDVSDEYAASLRAMGEPYVWVVPWNHVLFMREEYGVPTAWQLAHTCREFSWTNPQRSVMFGVRS